MFEVCKVCDKDAAILTWMSEVCFHGPIKIHILPVIKRSSVAKKESTLQLW